MTLVKKHPWMLLIPVLWLATWLAARMLNYDAIWVDEFLTYRITGTGTFPAHSVLETLRLSAVDASWWPPGYFLLFQGYELFFGGAPFLDRLSALFIGLVGITTVYQLTRMLGNTTIALTAAALLGTSAFYIYYMHELRGYTLFVTMASIHAIVYRLSLDPEKFSQKWVRYGLVLSTALALYTHYLAAFSILGIGVYHILFERKNPNFSRIIIFSVNGMLLFSPWIAATILTVNLEANIDRSLPLDAFFTNFFSSISNDLIIIALVLLAYSLLLIKRRSIQFLWVWGAVNILTVTVSNFWLSFLFHPRHVLNIFVIVVALIAFSLQDIQRRFQLPLALILGIWISAGAILTADSTFMTSKNLNGRSVPTMSVINKTSEIATSCPTQDSILLFAFDEPQIQWVQDSISQLYFEDFDTVPLAHIVTDSWGRPSILISKELQSKPVDERVTYLVQNYTDIWIFSRADLPVQDDVAYLTAELVQRGFSYCEVQDDVDLYAGVFTREAIEDCTQICQMGTSN